MTKTTAQQNLSAALKSITLARIHANAVLAQVRK
jgi:capsule polysaccharide export protein KpsE/RkpR